MCDTFGGTEVMACELVERADPALIRSTLVTLGPPGPVAARLARRGVPARSLGQRGTALAVWRLAAILHREQFDVINVYGLKASLVARLLSRALSPTSTFICGVRGLHVTEVESMRSAKSLTAMALERSAARFVDIYDANSLGALRLLRRLGVPEQQLRYIPNGIDLSAWPAVQRPRPAAPTLLCVARFVARKRQLDLVEAIGILRDRGVFLRCILAGDGPTRDRVAARVRQLDLADRVEMPGSVQRSAVTSLMAQATIFSLVSTWEGMAGTVMEAMASGLPVVGTDVNGISDLVIPGETGLLVEPGRPAAIAAALEQLIADPERAAEMGARGRARVAGDFSMSAMVHAKQQLYLEVAARSSHPVHGSPGRRSCAA